MHTTACLYRTVLGKEETMKNRPSKFYHGPEEGKPGPMILYKKPYHIFYHGSGKMGAAYDPKKHHIEMNYYHGPEEEKKENSSLVN